jgi:hypothetical protein
MSQHNFDIGNQSASDARTDINNALKALASLSSGSTAPTTTYANMPWYDTGTNTLTMLSEAKDAWISIGYLNQSTNTFALFDNTKVVDSGGTQTGLLGDQVTSDWETGTGTTESLVSPAKVKAAVEALAPQASDIEASDMSSVSAGNILLSYIKGVTQTGNGTSTVKSLVVHKACTLRFNFDVSLQASTSVAILLNGATQTNYTSGGSKTVDISLSVGDTVGFSATGSESGGGDLLTGSVDNIEVRADKRSFVFYPTA